MVKASKVSVPSPAIANRADVVRLLGDIDEESAMAVLVLEPTAAELDEARAWLDGEGDRPARRGHPQTPRIAAILEIVDREDDEPTYLR